MFNCGAQVEVVFLFPHLHIKQTQSVNGSGTAKKTATELYLTDINGLYVAAEAVSHHHYVKVK